MEDLNRIFWLDYRLNSYLILCCFLLVLLDSDHINKLFFVGSPCLKVTLILNRPEYFVIFYFQMNQVHQKSGIQVVKLLYDSNAYMIAKTLCYSF